MKHAIVQRLGLSGLFAVLACAAARADVHRGHAWLQGSNGPAFGLANFDLDDETGAISITVDVQGLSNNRFAGRLEGAAGEVLCTLVPVAGGSVAFGIAALTPAAIASVFSGQTRLVIATPNFPQGEIDGPIGAGGLESFGAPFSGSQVVPPVVGPATGMAYASISVSNGCSVSGQLHNLAGSITSIELWRDAWLGEQGTLVTTITTIGNPSPGSFTFSQQFPTPTPELRRDLSDGMCYLLVRTSAHPQGELRAQVRPPSLGDNYCNGRPNSVAILGARLSLTGSPRAAANDLVAHGTSLPAGRAVLPIVGLATGHVFNPAGLGGMLCVSGVGVARLGQHAGLSTAQGTFETPLDLSLLGAPFSAAPGLRLNMQLWYRDPAGPSTTNLSSAVSLVFH